MLRNLRGRAATLVIFCSMLLVSTVLGAGFAAADEDHAVVGRWSITSDAGGAVWAFQPGGELVVIGPGEVMSEGIWAAVSEDELDASVDVQITGQALEVMAQVSPDTTAIALYVTATEAMRPDDWTPWPVESRLIGERFGMMVEETPEPSPPPMECLRPQWLEATVDWDRCDEDVADS